LGLLAPIRQYIETLVHPAAAQDVLTAARHRAFIFSAASSRSPAFRSIC
jgi:hypothetical protein